MTVLRAKPSLKKKRKPKKQQQPIRRSPLMANALLPLMPSTKKKKKSDEGQPKVEGRRKVSGNATQTLLVIRDSLERLVRPKKMFRSSQRRSPEATGAVKLEKVSHQPVSVETFYDKGQRMGAQRLAPMPFKQSKNAHLTAGGLGEKVVAGGVGTGVGGGVGVAGGIGIGVGSSGSAQSSGGQSTVHPVSVKQNQKNNNEMEVPLTTRLPIIDFISTDDFARMHASKKQKAARRLALSKEAKELRQNDRNE
ncbi:hypothetical protein ACLKA6_009154 [Drosophila palustris]